MPELPEVETVLRTLRPYVTGHKLLDTCFFSKLVVSGSPEKTSAKLRNVLVNTIFRHGKYLIFQCQEGRVFTIHLGMTGKLLWEAIPGPHTRAMFQFDNGRLFFDDIRQFGRIEAANGIAPCLSGLGPDALAINASQFVALLSKRKGMIKPLLLNQSVLAGVGNIYADEILHKARMHPKAVASRLSQKRLRVLYDAMRETLFQAIQSGGSSVSDYLDAEGRQGSFQFQHAVYGKTGCACLMCGSPIRRILVAQRGTHYCVRCQRL